MPRVNTATAGFRGRFADGGTPTQRRRRGGSRVDLDRLWQQAAPRREGGGVDRSVRETQRGVRTTGREARQAARGVLRGSELDRVWRQIEDIEEGREKGGGFFDFLDGVPGLGRAADIGEDILTSGPVQDVLRTVDIPRAAVTSGLMELHEEISGDEGEGESFKEQFNRRIGFGEVVEASQPNLPQWAKIGLGLTGDVAFDPLTYTGIGLGAKAAGAGRGAIGAGGVVSRKALARQVLESGARAGLDDVGVRTLAAEAGRRGTGAFTRRGLARAGISDELAQALRVPEMGVSVRIPGRRGTIRGSRAVAEAVAGTKGAVKARVFKPLDVNVIAAETARRFGAAQGRQLVDQLSQELRNASKRGQPLHGIGKLSPEQHKNIIDALESGAVGDRFASRLRDFWDGVYAGAKQSGVEVDYRSGYVPHRLSLHGKEFISDSDAMRRMGVDENFFESAFQKPRTITADTELWGERVGTPTIKRINELSLKHEGFELLETDLSKLLQQSISEAGAASERAGRLTGAQRLGFARRAAGEVEQTAEDQAVRAARKEEARQYGLAAKENSKVLKTARELANRLKRGEAGNRAAVEEAISESVAKTERLALLRDNAQQGIEVAKAALAEQRRIAGITRRVERRRALAQVARLQDEVARRTGEMVRATEQYQQELTNLVAATDHYNAATRQAAEEARQAAEHAGRQVRMAEEAVEQAESTVPSGAVTSEGIEQAQRTLDEAVEDVKRLDEEAKVVALDRAEGVDLMREIDARIGVLSQIVDGTHLGAAMRRAAPVDRGAARILAERARTTAAAVKSLDDPAVQQVADIEARAIARETDALIAGLKTRGRKVRADPNNQFGFSALNDPKVQDITKVKIAEGMREVGPGWEADPQFAQAFQRLVSIFDDPKQVNVMVQSYDTFNRWFRTWAVTSPGFIVRNAQGAWINNYAHGVVMKDYKDFAKALNVYRRHPENWRQQASLQGVEEQLMDAVEGIAGSGWGQSAGEAAMEVFKGTRRGEVSRRMGVRLGRPDAKGLKPLPFVGSDAMVTRGVRHVNSYVEGLVRGALAWSVVRKGGSVFDALALVDKVHFNYLDLSDFDKWAKRVHPFWVFTSRNIPLQLDMLWRKPQVINRTWGNLQRNLTQGEEDDEILPDYFDTIAAFRAAEDVPGIGGKYVNLDLPIFELNELGERITDPTQFLSDVQPLPRSLLELGVGESFFSGAPINAERAPSPIWGGLVEPLGLAEDGKMRRDVRALLEALAPPLSRASRLAPEARTDRPDAGSAAKSRQIASLISTLGGVGVRDLTPTMQRGEMLRRRAQLQELIDELESRK